MTVDSVIALASHCAAQDTLRPMTKYEIISAWEQFGWMLITIGGLYFAFRQLRVASTVSLLQSENMLFDNMRRVNDSAADIILLQSRTLKEGDAIEKELTALQKKELGNIQNYLNSLDRFCAIVLRKIIKEVDAKREYLSVLDDAVLNYKKYFADFDEHFSNIIKLRKRWRGL